MRQEQDHRRREKEAFADRQADVKEAARQDHGTFREEELDEEGFSRHIESGQDQPDRDDVPGEVTDGELREGLFWKDSEGDGCCHGRGGDDVHNRDEMSREVPDGEAVAGKDVNEGKYAQED